MKLVFASLVAVSLVASCGRETHENRRTEKAQGVAALTGTKSVAAPVTTVPVTTAPAAVDLDSCPAEDASAQGLALAGGIFTGDVENSSVTACRVKRQRFQCMVDFLKWTPGSWSLYEEIEAYLNPLKSAYRVPGCADDIRNICKDILATGNATPDRIASCKRLAASGNCIGEWFNPLIASRAVDPFKDLDAHTVFWITAANDGNVDQSRAECKAGVLSLCSRVEAAIGGPQNFTAISYYNQFCSAIVPRTVFPED